MKFLIDMNLSPLWISFLAEHGFEALHWSTLGQPGAADSEILDFAAANGWIIFTHDLDFGMLLAALRTRPSQRPSGSRSGRSTTRLATPCSAPFASPSRTSRLAHSLPWILSVIVSGYCQSERWTHRQRFSAGSGSCAELNVTSRLIGTNPCSMSVLAISRDLYCVHARVTHLLSQTAGDVPIQVETVQALHFQCDAPVQKESSPRPRFYSTRFAHCQFVRVRTNMRRGLLVPARGGASQVPLHGRTQR